MIVSVTSKDGVRLYTKVQAKSGTQAEATRAQLQAAAGTRDALELLADEYYTNPGCAALGVNCEGCRNMVRAGGRRVA